MAKPRRYKRALRRRIQRDAALRAQSQKLRARIPVREDQQAKLRHRRQMRADATTGRAFPYLWAKDW